MDSDLKKVVVIGAGLAGSEAAFCLANHGVHVVLVESKKLQKGPHQKSEKPAELVCTNGLKSLDPHSGHGLLKTEMEKLNSFVLKMGKECSVPAGGALAVDREMFSERIENMLRSHPHIEWVDEIVEDPLKTQEKFKADAVLISTGPISHAPFEKWLEENIGGEDLYFYDAIAPVVDAEGLNYDKLYFKDRYEPISEEEGMEADYLNAPFTQEEYEYFIRELVEAEVVPPAKFEELKFFESCLPIDEMAKRGVDTPRFGPMKPVGLELPDGQRPYACVQLRRENRLGSCFNLVGFQTRLKYPEQQRVFRLIPGLEEASFLSLGSVHRNSFLNSRVLLNHDLSSKKFPQIFFAGQIIGVEGYTESASMGLVAAHQILWRFNNKKALQFPKETAMGALLNYIFTWEKAKPSNINFGLIPPVALTKEQRRQRKGRKKLKKELTSIRAQASFDHFMQEQGVPLG